MYHVLLGCYPVSISLFPMRFSRGYFYKCLLADQTAPCPHGGLKLMLETGQGGEGVEEGSDYSPHTSSFSSTPQKRRKLILKPYGTYRYAVSLGGAPEPSSTLWVCWGALRLASSPHLAVAVSFTGFLIALLPARLLPGLQHLCCIMVQNTIPALRQANCISFVSLAQLQKRHWN